MHVECKVASLILLLYYFFCDLPINVFWPCALTADLPPTVYCGSVASVGNSVCVVFKKCKATVEKVDGITLLVNRVEKMAASVLQL